MDSFSLCDDCKVSEYCTESDKIYNCIFDSLYYIDEETGDPITTFKNNDEYKKIMRKKEVEFKKERHYKKVS